MKGKKIPAWLLLGAALVLGSCSWLQDEYFFTYSSVPRFARMIPDDPGAGPDPEALGGLLGPRTLHGPSGTPPVLVPAGAGAVLSPAGDLSRRER